MTKQSLLPHVRQAIVEQGGQASFPFYAWLQRVQVALDSGSISNEQFEADIRALAIALGSPDGTVAGIPELAGFLRDTAAVIGQGSIEHLGSLKDGSVVLQLTGDSNNPQPFSYYGVSPEGVRGYSVFPENLQGISALSSAGFPIRNIDGSWELRLLGGSNGIVITDDGTTITITANPYFKALDNGDSPAGQAIVSAEQTVALGSGANAAHLDSVALGHGSATTATSQVNIGNRTLEMSGHTLTATAGGLLYDGSPIGGGSGNSYFPRGW